MHVRLIYLDDYTLGDPLFLNQLSRTMGRLDAPAILVHGAHERLNRRLEGAGHLPGVDPEPTPETLADEVERAHREENRTIVHALNEAHVAVVGVLAAQRRLLHMVGDVPEAGDVAWLNSLASSGVVPVVSLAASSEVGWQDGEVWKVIAALATSLQVASGNCSVLHFRAATQMDVLREALPPSIHIREVTLSALTAQSGAG